jgi:hypothetical protein
MSSASALRRWLRTPEVLEGVERILAGGEAETIPFAVLVPVQRHYEAHLVRTRDRLVVLRIRDLTALRRPRSCARTSSPMPATSSARLWRR